MMRAPLLLAVVVAAVVFVFLASGCTYHNATVDPEQAYRQLEELRADQARQDAELERAEARLRAAIRRAFEDSQRK